MTNFPPSSDSAPISPADSARHLANGLRAPSLQRTPRPSRQRTPHAISSEDSAPILPVDSACLLPSGLRALPVLALLICVFANDYGGDLG
ncbi:hypothetical protein ACLB2K_060143 [Fragaria x ananassa]